MIKKVVIAGCRDYNNYAQAKEYIDFCLSNIRKTNETNKWQKSAIM